MMEADFVTGPAKNVLSFARLARPDVEIATVTFQRGGNEASAESNPYVQAARAAGVPVHVLCERRRFDAEAIRRLQVMVAETRPDIIQTHGVKSHFFLRYSNLFRTFRWLAFHHGYTTPDLKMRMYNQLNRWSLRRAMHVVTVCEPFRTQLLRQGIPEDRITIRHNAVVTVSSVPEDTVVSIKMRHTIPASARILLTVSRLSQEKGHLDLLQALLLLPQSVPQWHLVIVGEGPERAAIGRMLSLHPQLRRSVTLVGHQHDTRPFFQMADVFLLPSHSEGSPNALLEAMATGIPAVACAVGGVPEIATNGQDALLVPARDPRALAQAISSTLVDPTGAAERVVRAREVTSRFTPTAYRQSMLGLYARLMQLRPGQIA
jgi:glycosyltransferase involved in cell wall biosynthesis